MAYPASIKTLSQVLGQVDGIMLMIKSNAADLRTKSAAGPIPAQDVTDYLARLAGLRATLASLAATPNLGAYAQAQKSSPGLDAVAEYTATVAQIDATRAWIITNFPRDAQGNVESRNFNAEGVLVAAGPLTGTFTSAQLAGLRTVLSALEATVS